MHIQMKEKLQYRFLGRVLFLGILMIGLMALTACTHTPSPKEQTKGQQRYAWPLATASSEDAVTHLFAIKFSQEVNRLSNGRMKIQVYSNSVLGGDRELLESCKDGDIPFIVQNTAPQVAFMPELAVFDLPEAFVSIEEARQAVDSESFFKRIAKVYQTSGYHLMVYADQGFRVLTTNKAIHQVSDLKHIKIRTMENSNHIAFWKAQGTNPTPMTFSEVYIGLQQGTIDAQENAIENIVSSKLYEQQKYLVETNHLPHYISLVVSDAFFKKLSKEDQAILQEASEIAKKYARQMADERHQERLEVLKEKGVIVLPFSEALHEEMGKNSAGVYDQIEKQVGKDLVESYLKKE